jgi:hypothetical protein
MTIREQIKKRIDFERGEGKKYLVFSYADKDEAAVLLANPITNYFGGAESDSWYTTIIIDTATGDHLATARAETIEQSRVEALAGYARKAMDNPFEYIATTRNKE